MANTSKLIAYKSFRSVDYYPQTYLGKLKDSAVRKSFTKFRTGSHWLDIETGRFLKKPKAERFCSVCGRNEIGDESHFIFQCPAFDIIRQQYQDLFREDHDLQSFMLQDYRKVASFVHECYTISVQ